MVPFKEISAEGAFGLVPHTQLGLNLLFTLRGRLATGDGLHRLRHAPFR